MIKEYLYFPGHDVHIIRPSVTVTYIIIIIIITLDIIKLYS